MVICDYCKEEKPCFRTVGETPTCLDCMITNQLTMVWITPQKEKNQNKYNVFPCPYYPKNEIAHLKSENRKLKFENEIILNELENENKQLKKENERLEKEVKEISSLFVMVRKKNKDNIINN